MDGKILRHLNIMIKEKWLGLDGCKWGLKRLYIYNGNYTELLPVGWIDSDVLKINNNGEVVGLACKGSGTFLSIVQ